MSGPPHGPNCSPGSSGQKTAGDCLDLGNDNEQPDCIITGADVAVSSSQIHISGVSYKSELQVHWKGKHLLQ